MQIVYIALSFVVLLVFLKSFHLAFLWGKNVSNLPNLDHQIPLKNFSFPSISIVFAARNEEIEVGRSCYSFLNQQVPAYEVIAVNDRSCDRTAGILETIKLSFERLKVVHIHKLPAHWIGKSYALWQGAQQASGEWLLFTDADVRFSEDTLSKAVFFAEKNKLDMLTVFPRIEASGFLLMSVLLSFVSLMGYQISPWKLKNKNDPDALGIGAFNMVRSSVYNTIGQHQAFSLSVLDDIDLARRVKKAGFKLDVIIGTDNVSLRWKQSTWDVITGLEKNFFAGLGFSRFLSWSVSLWLLIATWAPWLGLIFLGGFWKVLSGAALFCDFLYAGFNLKICGSLFRGLLLRPLGLSIISYAIVRSMKRVRSQGGIKWRDTFYSLNAYPDPTWRQILKIVRGAY